MSTVKLSMVITDPSGPADRIVSVRLMDESAHMLFAEFELTPEQFTDVLSTRTVYFDAKVPDEPYRDRWFKQRQHLTHAVPKELGSKWDYERDDDVKDAVNAWVEQTRVDGDWDIGRLALRSQQFYATFERWVEVES